jgi:hypothetical protein
MGWTGKILRIDLTARTAKSEPTNMDWAMKYLGQRGLATKYLVEEVDAKVDPLGPGNKLILATGPLTGTAASTGGRYSVVTKGPLTNAIACSNSGGYFGAELKFAGWDMVIIEGKASSPVYLTIFDDVCEIHDAKDIWGTSVWHTDEWIKNRHQDPLLHVAGIRFVGDASGPFSPEAARQREQAIAQAFPSPLAGTATELAIRTGLADIPDMQNATEVPGLQRFAKIIGFNFAALFAPLMWEGKGIGAIAMLSTRIGPSGDRERALLKTFADQAVIAIQNARLFRETQEALERQTATADVLQVISSSVADTAPVFNKIIRSIIYQSRGAILGDLRRIKREARRGVGL